VISSIEKEVLISDALGEELDIMIPSLEKELWKLSDDPGNKVRSFYTPRYWCF